jgi:alginate O-acetyltransferase complex protein AlgI
VIFNELSYYLLFLLPTLVAFHLTRPGLRDWWLALAGVLFFAYYSFIHFGGWPAVACLLLFAVELLTSRLYRKGSAWCIWGIVQAVLVLVVFKYSNFGISLFNDWSWLHGQGYKDPFTWLFLPLGVSFFTFEFIHYAVDSYRGEVPSRPMARYAAFIFFFPTMVAGPIKRFGDFDRKLEVARFSWPLVERGITRILVGMVKKQVLADTFGLWADRLNTPELFDASPLNILLWIFAYGQKIYFDFSGYSDIAIGSAYLFGLRIPENFDYPYLRTSITDFWRHWHVSLYLWIRDYIFIPLGGSRGTALRTALNTLTAFAISGLWHGANGGFVVWGLWHGVLLVVHRLWRGVRPAWLEKSTAWMVFCSVATFVAVNLGWAFFCMDLDRALFALSRIMGFQ